MSSSRRVERTNSNTFDFDWSKINFGERIRLDEEPAEKKPRDQLADCDYLFVLGGGRVCEVFPGSKTFIHSVYLGSVTATEAEKRVGDGGFGLYHKHTGGTGLYLSLPLFIVYKATPGYFGHLPVETGRLNGVLFYRLGFPKSPQFASLASLIRHHFE